MANAHGKRARPAQGKPGWTLRLAEGSFLAAIWFGVFATGATEVRPWYSAPFWALAALAGVAAAVDRSRPDRPRVALGGFAVPAVLGAGLVGWFAVAPVALADRSMYAMRLLSLAAAGALGFAGFHLASVGANTRRRTVRGLVALLAIQAVLTIAQGANGKGTYANHAHLAGLIELLLPLAIALGVDDGVGDGERHLGLYSAFAGLAALALAQSRGGWIAGGIAAALMLAKVARSRVGKLRVAAVAGAMLVGVGLLVAPNWERVGGRLASMEAGTVLREQGMRLHLWKVGWRMARAHAATGIGLGNFQARYHPYREPGLVVAPRMVHNDFLQLAAEGGAPAAGLGALLVLAVTIGLWRRQRDLPSFRYELYPAAALAGFAGICAHGLVDFNFQIPANLALTCALVGLGFGVGGELGAGATEAGGQPGGEPDAKPDAEPARRRRRRRKQRVPPAPLVVGLGAVACLLWFWVAVRELRTSRELARVATLRAGPQPAKAIPEARRAVARLPGDHRTHQAHAEALTAAAGVVDGADAAALLEAARDAWARVEAVGMNDPRLRVRASVVWRELRRRGRPGPDPHAALVEAAERGPHDPVILLPLAASFLARGEWDAAGDALRRGLEAYPAAERPVAFLSRLAAGIPRPEWVLEAVPPDFARGFMTLARVYEQRGLPRLAGKAWDRARSIDGDSAPIRRGRGAFLVGTGRFEEAILDLEQARLLMPAPDEFLYRQLVTAYDGAKRPAAAAAALERAAKLWPKDADFAVRLAERKRQDRSPEELEQDFRALLERFPEDPRPALRLAQMTEAEGRRLADRRRMRRAASQYRQVLRIEPDHLAGLAALARLYFDLGDVQRARVHLERLEELGSVDAGLLVLLGRAYFEAQRYPRARAVFLRAAKEDGSVRSGGFSAGRWALRSVSREVIAAAIARGR